jgi:N-acetylglutamate synthase-like GNAT family acetyltransferase
MDVDIIFNPKVPGQIRKMGKRMKEGDFMNLQNAIVSSVEEGGLCKRELRYQYVEKSIDKSPYIFLAYNDKRVICGFATVFHINNETLRIDIICTSEDASAGTGRSIMDKIEEFAKASKIKTLFLKSIGESMGFYESLGYSLNINANSGSNSNNSGENNNSMNGSNSSGSGSNSSGSGSNNNMNGSNSNSSSNSRSTRSSVISFAGDIPMSKKIGGGTRRQRRSKRKSASRKKSR